MLFYVSLLQEASEKLKQAEKDRTRLEEKVKLWQTPTIGLARPLPLNVNPLVTHRGEGAFCKQDFKRRPSEDENKPPDFENLHIHSCKNDPSNDVFPEIGEEAGGNENSPSEEMKMHFENVPIQT